MKKSASLLLSGILVSGMAFGTIITPATVQAATESTQATTDVTNTVTYYDRSGTEVATKSVTGKQGAKIGVVPDGYALVDGSNVVFGAEGAKVGVPVTPMISSKVNFVDQNDKLVQTITVNGGDGNAYTLSNLPEGCSWPKDATKTITLESGKEYNVTVNKQVSNTIIFKTADETEVGRTQIFGDKVGDKVTLTSDQVPAGYSVSNNDLNLQSDGNTQFVTVTKNAEGITPFKGTVRVGDKTAFLYTVDGKLISNRALGSGSDWKVVNKLVLNGKAYYQVATTEWVQADDVSVISQENDNNTDENSNVQTADRSVVTTKNVDYTVLYDINGKEIQNRGLGKDSPWATDKMQTLKGVKYYRVATNEWVKASDIL